MLFDYITMLGAKNIKSVLLVCDVIEDHQCGSMVSFCAFFSVEEN
jgi:hypothetical protein